MTKDPPNATLSIFSGDKVSDLVVEISNPVLSGTTLTYNAKVLEISENDGSMAQSPFRNGLRMTVGKQFATKTSIILL